MYFRHEMDNKVINDDSICTQPMLCGCPIRILMKSARASNCCYGYRLKRHNVWTAISTEGAQCNKLNKEPRKPSDDTNLYGLKVYIQAYIGYNCSLYFLGYRLPHRPIQQFYGIVVESVPLDSSFFFFLGTGQQCPKLLFNLAALTRF